MSQVYWKNECCMWLYMYFSIEFCISILVVSLLCLNFVHFAICELSMCLPLTRACRQRVIVVHHSVAVNTLLLVLHWHWIVTILTFEDFVILTKERFWSSTLSIFLQLAILFMQCAKHCVCYFVFARYMFHDKLCELIVCCMNAILL